MTAMPPLADILQPIIDRRNHHQRMAGSLADIIACLLSENEPLLKAERNETEITVTERGGGLAFTITVETRERGCGNASPGE